MRVPLVEISRQLEADPDTSLVADPVHDILVEWVSMRYGSDSHPAKLVAEVRLNCQENKILAAIVHVPTGHAVACEEMARAGSLCVRSPVEVIAGRDPLGGRPGRLPARVCFQF